MESVIFTKEELEDMTLKQLRPLAEYYGLDIPKRSKKEVVVNALDKYYRPEIVVESDSVPMSARIRRIKEMNNES